MGRGSDKRGGGLGRGALDCRRVGGDCARCAVLAGCVQYRLAVAFHIAAEVAGRGPLDPRGPQLVKRI